MSLVSRWAHPRSRGENAAAAALSCSASGSSLLTRGKRGEATGLREDAGLIPAHAGKTYRSQYIHVVMRVHPRSRGENRAEKAHPAFQKGSSPLTRGKRGEHRGHGHTGGLIPTHAGKTKCRAFALIGPGAHPRSCGENRRAAVEPRKRGGSSPLTRGKRYRRWPGFRRLRLIPAHAGKTSRRSSA